MCRLYTSIRPFYRGNLSNCRYSIVRGLRISAHEKDNCHFLSVFQARELFKKILIPLFPGLGIFWVAQRSISTEAMWSKSKTHSAVQRQCHLIYRLDSEDGNMVTAVQQKFMKAKYFLKQYIRQKYNFRGIYGTCQFSQQIPSQMDLFHFRQGTITS